MLKVATVLVNGGYFFKFVKRIFKYYDKVVKFSHLKWFDRSNSLWDANGGRDKMTPCINKYKRKLK